MIKWFGLDEKGNVLFEESAPTYKELYSHLKHKYGNVAVGESRFKEDDESDGKITSRLREDLRYCYYINCEGELVKQHIFVDATDEEIELIRSLSKCRRLEEETVQKLKDIIIKHNVTDNGLILYDNHYDLLKGWFENESEALDFLCDRYFDTVEENIDANLVDDDELFKISDSIYVRVTEKFEV